MPVALWVALALSFPVATLFEGDAEAGLSYTVMPSLIALAIGAVLGFNAASVRERVALVLAILLTAGVNYGFSQLNDGYNDPQKVVQYALVLALFGMLTALCFGSQKFIRHLDVAFLILGAVAAGAFFFNPGEYQGGRLSFGENNPIWMARVLGLMGLASFAIFVRNQRYAVLLGAAALISLVGIVLTGSRAPLLSLFCAIAVGALLFRYQNKATYLLFGGFLLVLVVLFMTQLGLFGSVRGLTFVGYADESQTVRENLYAYAFYLIQHNPQGIGIGRFFFYWFTYPHNIFVEAFVEWGWAFGALFTLSIISGIFGLFRMSPFYNMLKMLAVYEVINAAFSGDLTSPRFLYGLVIFGNAYLLQQYLTRSIRFGGAGGDIAERRSRWLDNNV